MPALQLQVRGKGRGGRQVPRSSAGSLQLATHGQCLPNRRVESSSQGTKGQDGGHRQPPRLQTAGLLHCPVVPGGPTPAFSPAGNRAGRGLQQLAAPVLPPCREGAVAPWSRALASSHSGLGSLGGLPQTPFGIFLLRHLQACSLAEAWAGQLSSSATVGVLGSGGACLPVPVSVWLCRITSSGQMDAWSWGPLPSSGGKGEPGTGTDRRCRPQVPLKVSLSAGQSWGHLVPLQEGPGPSAQPTSR